jgi:hypothetical protein
MNELVNIGDVLYSTSFIFSDYNLFELPVTHRTLLDCEKFKIDLLCDWRKDPVEAMLICIENKYGRL